MDRFPHATEELARRDAVEAEHERQSSLVIEALDDVIEAQLASWIEDAVDEASYDAGVRGSDTWVVSDADVLRAICRVVELRLAEVAR